MHRGYGYARRLAHDAEELIKGSPYVHRDYAKTVAKLNLRGGLEVTVVDLGQFIAAGDDGFTVSMEGEDGGAAAAEEKEAETEEQAGKIAFR